MPQSKYTTILIQLSYVHFAWICTWFGLYVVLCHIQRYSSDINVKKVEIRSRSQCHWHFIGFFNAPVQHRHRAILSVLPRLDPSMAQLDSNLRMILNYVVNLDNGQIHCANGVKTIVTFYDNGLIHCAHGVKTLVAFYDTQPPWGLGVYDEYRSSVSKCLS